MYFVKYHLITFREPLLIYQTLRLSVIWPIKHFLASVLHIRYNYSCCKSWCPNHCPGGNFKFKANKINNRTRCEIYSKLTIRTLERRQWCCSCVLIVNVEQINADWVKTLKANVSFLYPPKNVIKLSFQDVIFRGYIDEILN